LALTQDGGQTTKAHDWISKEKKGWTHGFFMQGHTMEYNAEHAAAAKEGRSPDPAKMRDYKGRDMCLPDYLGYACCEGEGTCCRTPPSDVGFAEYKDCNDELGNRERFRAQMGSVDVTFLVPWHVLRPEESPHGPYLFTNSVAAELDCKTALQREWDIPGGYEWLSQEHSEFAVSGAVANRKNADGTRLMASHQCIVACDGDGRANKVGYQGHVCYPGAVVWMARDAVHQALKSKPNVE
jgi:hypothetical protein